MSLLTECGHPKCGMLTLGDRCIAHVKRNTGVEFPRGRPYLRPSARELAPPWDVARSAVSAGKARAGSCR